MRRIALALARLAPQADIIALQEVDDLSMRSALGRHRRRERRGVPTSQLDRFLALLNEASLEVGGHVYQGEFFAAQGHHKLMPLYSTGLAILYRSTLEQVDHNAYAPHDITHRRLKRLARMKQKRICAWSRFRDPQGSQFDLFNTHLSLPAFLQRHTEGSTGGRFGEADNQVQEVERVLDFMGRHGDPSSSILVGDFNALPGSRVYERVLEEGPLRDAHATFLGAEPTAMRRMPSAGFMNLRYRLDHIFSGPSVRFSNFHHTRPYDRAHPWRALSDHAPIACRFSLTDVATERERREASLERLKGHS